MISWFQTVLSTALNYNLRRYMLGINGCGKTTTFRMAAGDLPPTRGKVSIAVAGGHASAVGRCRCRWLTPGLNSRPHACFQALSETFRGFQHLKLNHSTPLSSFAFNCNTCCGRARRGAWGTARSETR